MNFVTFDFGFQNECYVDGRLYETKYLQKLDTVETPYLGLYV